MQGCGRLRLPAEILQNAPGVGTVKMRREGVGAAKRHRDGGGIAIAAAACFGCRRLQRGTVFEYGIENWGTGRIGLFLPNLREPRGSEP